MSKRYWIIIRFAVAIGLIVFFLTKINYSDVVNSVVTAKLHFVLPALLLTVIAWIVSSYRLKYFTYLQGLTISTFQAFEINLSTLFYGLFLPGGNLTGGIIKFYKISRKDNQLSAAFIALALERIFATVALCFVGLFFWIINGPKETNLLVLVMIIILLGLTCFCVLIFFERDQRVIRWSMRFVNDLYYSEKLNKFVENLSSLSKIPYSTIIFMLAISLASQLINVIVFFLLLNSMDINISIASIGWIRSLVVLITMIPISISGMGLREGSFIFILGTYGVGEETAFAYSLLIFAVTRIFPGLLGGLFELKNLTG